MTAADDRKTRLIGIRHRLGVVKNDEWRRVVSPDGDYIETRRAVDGVGHGAPETLMTFAPSSDPTEAMVIWKAREDLEFLLSMLDQAFAEVRRLKRFDAAGAADRPRDGGGRIDGGRNDGPRDETGVHGEPKDYAAEAAMKCADPQFQQFLAERSDQKLPRNADDAAHMLRQALDIKSRAELNRDRYKARLWRELRADFAGWLRS